MCHDICFTALITCCMCISVEPYIIWYRNVSRAAQLYTIDSWFWTSKVTAMAETEAMMVRMNVWATQMELHYSRRLDWEWCCIVDRYPFTSYACIEVCLIILIVLGIITHVPVFILDTLFDGVGLRLDKTEDRDRARGGATDRQWRFIYFLSVLRQYSIWL